MSLVFLSPMAAPTWDTPHKTVASSPRLGWGGGGDKIIQWSMSLLSFLFSSRSSAPWREEPYPKHWALCLRVGLGTPRPLSTWTGQGQEGKEQRAGVQTPVHFRTLTSSSPVPNNGHSEILPRASYFKFSCIPFHRCNSRNHTAVYLPVYKCRHGNILQNTNKTLLTVL